LEKTCWRLFVSSPISPLVDNCVAARAGFAGWEEFAAMPGEEHQPQNILPGPPVSRPAVRRRLAFGLSFSKVRSLLPLLCLFQAGLLVGSWCLLAAPDKQVNEPAEAPAVAPRVPPPPTVNNKVPKQAESGPARRRLDFQRGDELLRQERYELALAAYPPPNAFAAAPAAAQLHYRVALALEGLGRLEEAVASYRQAGNGMASPIVAAAAQVGQARALLRLGQPAEARALLYPVLLRSAAPELVGRAFLADARYLLALGAAREAQEATKPGSLLDAMLAPPVVAGPPADYLAWVTSPPAKAKKAPALPTGLRVQHTAANAEEITVGGAARDTDVVRLVEQLAELGKLRLEWTARARQRADARTTTVAVDGWPLLHLVVAVTDPLGLVVKAESGRLLLAAIDDTTPALLAAYRATVARRTLQETVLMHPGHALAAPAYLLLGNAEAATGKFPEAVAWYERLLRDFPRCPVVPEAAYNLGLARDHLGKSAAARRAFYRGVDQAPAGPLAPLAYLQVGHTYLEEGQPREALVPLKHALAPGSSAEPAAVVALAAAHLLAGAPSAAHALLVARRQRVGGEPYRQVAAFLDALARFRMVSAQKISSRGEAGELLAALLEVPGQKLLGPSGTLLAGQAYIELGMSDQAALLFEKARALARGPVAAEMTFRLADIWYAGDRRARARDLFAALAADGNSRWALQARLKLAVVALAENRPRECIQACQALVNGHAENAGDALQLMGAAFERLGEHSRAAACFAGRLPE
jgi:tetratricopeptide (TPR) repeat protein